MGACRMLFSARWWNKSPHTHDSSLRSLKRKIRELSELFIRHSTPSVSDRNSATVEGDKYFFTQFRRFPLQTVYTLFFFIREERRESCRPRLSRRKEEKRSEEENWWEKRGHLKVPFDTHKSHRRITLMTNYRGRMSRLKKISVRKSRDSLKRSLAWPDDAFDVRWWRDDSQVLFILPSRLVGQRLTTSCLSVILELPPPSIYLYWVVPRT